MFPPRPARLAVLAAVLAVVATPLASPTAVARHTVDAKVATSSSSARASAALEQARAVFAPRVDARAEPRGSAPVSAPDATMALRDLANLRVELTGADRAAAEALLKRPTDAGGDGGLNYGPVDEQAPVCDPDVCIHYVATGRHAATPEFVAATAATLDDVHDAFIAAGYREPLPDAGRGGNSKIDIYLGDIGDGGLYGYCTSDQPETDPTPSRYDRWAYCVLDNDYASDEFPTNTSLENLQVTAAHEYFHAVQFAYDRYEDAWLLEATASWVEDEMYDEVDDNLQYLASSQLSRPSSPLDTFDASTGFHYGTWTFFRYITEKYREKKGSLPRFVLDVWKRADGAPGGRDEYSWQAINSVLRAKRTTGAAILGDYAVANRRPGTSYDEGAANNWRSAPLGLSRTLTPSRSTAQGSKRLAHLTTWTARFSPKDLAAKAWRLRVKVDMAPTRRGSVALVTVYTGTGKTTSRVKLDKRGDGSKVVAFSSSKVTSVEVTLINGSGRFDCFQGTPFSCAGIPLDDDVDERLQVEAFR